MNSSPLPAGSSKTVRLVRCDPVNRLVQLPEHPQRVVSFVSGLTEAIWAMGLEDRVVGVSAYCGRYVPTDGRPVAGDYLRIDEGMLRALQPVLVLMTSGVQLGVARRLLAAGWPVFVLPLPDSFAGVVDNLRRLGALLGEMEPAHALMDRMAREAAELRATAPANPPRIYGELWFGRHPRMVGGLTFIHDILELAGGTNIFRGVPASYLALDAVSVAAAKPEAIVVFSEADDHPVDGAELMRERGWTGSWPFVLIESGVQRGQNLIHDGPSLLDTVRWLRAELVARRPNGAPPAS